MALSKVWRLAALVHLMACHAAEMEIALTRALGHAQRASDDRELAEVLFSLPANITRGPTPVAEAMHRCTELLDLVPGTRETDNAVKAALALLHSMAGHAAEGRRLIAETRAAYRDLGMAVVYASSAMLEGEVELYLGDLAAAEAAFRSGIELLVEMGERAHLPTIAARLAQTLCELGRFDEADEFTRQSEQVASGDDIGAQIGWRTQRAHVLAGRGDHVDAERLAREAVELTRTIDFVDDLAGAQLALGAVLRAADRAEDAAPYVAEALRLYEAKGIVRYERMARALLAELVAQPPLTS